MKIKECTIYLAMNLILIALFLIVNIQKVTAAEFPWYKIRESYQGYVEFVDGNQVTRNIYVLPVLGLPGTAYFHNTPWAFSGPTSNTGIEIADNGDLYLNFKIHTNNAHLPTDFKQDVINHIIGQGFNLSKYSTINTANYLIHFIKPQHTKVTLYIENKEFAVKTYDGILDGNFTDKFLIPSANLNSIRLGKFDVKIEYDFPYQNFSSLSINIKEELLTKVKIDVFRELIQQSSSSSGGFFIWKWKQRTHRVIERNRINFDASNTSNTDISIVYRDATPEMLNRINTVLGFYTTTKADLVAAHNAAYSQAMTNGNTALGDLHKKYIDAVQADDVSKSIDVLKAAAALSDGNLFTFLASGVAFSEASSSSYSSFHGIKRVNITSTSNTVYNEIMINTVTAKLSTTGFKPANMMTAINDAYKQKNLAIFNKPSYLPLYTVDWVPAFFQAVINNDLSTLKYLTTYFTPISQVNALNGQNKNTTLHLAAQSGNLEIIKELIRFGVNPKLKNRYDETAREIALEKGYTNIATYLQAQESNLGTVQVRFDLPSGYVLEAVNYYGLELPYMQGLDLRSKVQVFTTNPISFKYHPGTYQISFDIFYRDPNGFRRSTMITNIYKIKSTSRINYSEALIFRPDIQVLTNGSTTYAGTMTDPVYWDN